MRALVKERPEPGLVLAEVPDPVPGPGEVRIRVKKAAIWRLPAVNPSSSVTPMPAASRGSISE